MRSAGFGISRRALPAELGTILLPLMGVLMAFLFDKFHTSLEVWNKYGTWKGAWIVILPYLPHLPYLPPPAYIRAGVRACARMRVCVFINYGMEGMEVWNSGFNIWSQPSTPVPYLKRGMEHSVIAFTDDKGERREK